MKRKLASTIRWTGGCAAFAITAYASYVCVAWCRYGRARSADQDESRDEHLDLYIPVYDIVEHHQVRVDAPAEATFAAACSLHLLRSPLIAAIFKTREMALGATPGKNLDHLGLADQAKAWGWSVLAEEPGREIVFGAATQPWTANPVFLPLSSTEFPSFHKPDYVKIAWTLRSEPIDAMTSVAITETRVTTTDRGARAKFRRYWALVSPGIILVRRLALRLVKREAERLATYPGCLQPGNRADTRQPVDAT